MMCELKRNKKANRIVANYKVGRLLSVIPISLLVICTAAILCACITENEAPAEDMVLKDEDAGMNGEKDLENDNSALDDDNAGIKKEEDLENMVYMIPDKATYNIGEDIVVYSIYNQTTNYIGFSHGTVVEIQSGTGWERIPFIEEVAFPLDFIPVAPGETVNDNLFMSLLTQHTTGRYRITKEVNIENKTGFISLEFEVK